MQCTKSFVEIKEILKECPPKKEDILSLLKELNLYFKKQPLETVDFLLDYFPQEKINNIKVIAVFYTRLFDGGVERVISRQLPMFIKLGYKVVLITEQINPELEFPIPSEVQRVIIPRKVENGRLSKLLSVFQQFDVDLLITHASSGQMLLWDILATRLFKRQAIVCKHEVVGFDLMIDLNQKRLTNFLLEPKILKLANAVVVLSGIDRGYLRCFDVNAFFIPNPPSFSLNKTFARASNKNNTVVWIGRLDESTKNYKTALEIMKRLANQRKSIKCLLVGPPSDPESEKYVLNFIKRNNLEDRVKWIKRSRDIERILLQSDIHLITSSVESFSMVIVESKIYGLPLILSGLEHIEILKEGGGFVSCSQGDRNQIVNTILELMDDDITYSRLSYQATESIKDFYHKNDVEKGWSDLLHGVSKAIGPTGKDFEFYVKLQRKLIVKGLDKRKLTYKLAKLKSKLFKPILKILKKVL